MSEGGQEEGSPPEDPVPTQEQASELYVAWLVAKFQFIGHREGDSIEHGQTAPTSAQWAKGKGPTIQAGRFNLAVIKMPC